MDKLKFVPGNMYQVDYEDHWGWFRQPEEAVRECPVMSVFGKCLDVNAKTVRILHERRSDGAHTEGTGIILSCVRRVVDFGPAPK